MKIVLAIALTLFTVAPALGQADNRTAEPPRHSYGWIGLFGLAGLAVCDGRRAPSTSDSPRLA
jgi:hypothetical protein